MFELTGREIAALITAIVGVGSFLFALARFPTERSDKKQDTSFHSQEEMRQTYRTISVDIMGAVGRVMSPRSTAEFKQAWYDIEQLYVGRVRLLPSVKGYAIIPAFEEFVRAMWGTWDYMSAQRDLEEGAGPEHKNAKWGKMESASADLATALQKMISYQYNIGSVPEIKQGDSFEDKTKSDSKT